MYNNYVAGHAARGLNAHVHKVYVDTPTFLKGWSGPSNNTHGHECSHTDKEEANRPKARKTAECDYRPRAPLVYSCVTC